MEGMARVNELAGVAGSRGKSVRRSGEEWSEEVAAWRRSGLPSKAYAKRRGISAATLLWWSSRHGKTGVGGRGGEGTGRRSRPADGPKQAGVGAFLPVRVTERTSEPSRVEVEIVVSGDRRVRVLGGLTLRELGRLVDVLEGGVSC